MKQKILFLAALVNISAIVNAQTNTFPTSGNVGIGTSNPQSILHLFSGGEAVQTIEGSSPYIHAGLQFIDASQSMAGKVKTWAIWAGTDGGTWASGLGFHRYDAVNPCGGGICSLSLFLHDNGNVGIGTTTPQAKLDVNGSASLNGNLTIGEYNATSNDTKGIFFPGYRDVVPNYFGASIETVNSWICCGGYPSGGYAGVKHIGLNFNIHDPNNWNANDKITVMSIAATGNVGIGTTSPDEKLTVNGIVHAKEVRVDLTGALADYVFSKDYSLMPLHKVEQYVKTNSHLPDIPSADEVKQQGLGMGEMQNKLLQKIEELTLYVIQQQKEIQALKERIGTSPNPSEGGE